MLINRRAILLLAVVLVGLALVAVTQISARTAPGAGEVIRFAQGDYVFSDSPAPPTTGWRPYAFPSRKLLSRAPKRYFELQTAWVRFRFDRTRFGADPLALYASAIEENFSLYANGVEIYRTRGGRRTDTFGWNHPLYVPVPPMALRPGANEILLRVTTKDPQPLVVGAVAVGPDDAIRPIYERENFWVISAPQIITGYILILTIGAFAFWLKRPKEAIFGWLGLVGLVWIFRNLHYFVQSAPFSGRLFWSLTTDSIFVLLSVSFLFCVRYFALERANRLSWIAVAVCCLEIGGRHLLVALHQSELPSFLLALPLSAFFLTLLSRACLRSPGSGRWLMLAAMASAVVFSFHDLGRSVDAWSGIGVALQPYGGLFAFAAFDITLTSRLQSALIDVEDVNERLEARVVEVTESLGRSEASRAMLQISVAIDHERERIMREIHDGIGSNLVTALALAQRQTIAGGAVAVLRQSITDLKIAVDSLEPVEGDLIVLLANLRHRMEGDLRAAGVETIWNVESCPPLPWLNPVNALHILRIVQEAIGNVLIHARASTIIVGCEPQPREGKDGILVSIIDNGIGPQREATGTVGRGLANMKARAEALGGVHRFAASLPAGSCSTLWLPLRLEREQGSRMP